MISATHSLRSNLQIVCIVQEAVRSADPKWQVRSCMPTWKRAQAHYKIICCAGQKSMDELRLTMRRIRDRPMLSITHERENTFTRGKWASLIHWACPFAMLSRTKNSVVLPREKHHISRTVELRVLLRREWNVSSIGIKGCE